MRPRPRPRKTSKSRRSAGKRSICFNEAAAAAAENPTAAVEASRSEMTLQ